MWYICTYSQISYRCSQKWQNLNCLHLSVAFLHEAHLPLHSNVDYSFFAFLILHMTVILNFGLFSELVFVLCEKIMFSLLKLFLPVKLGVIICWPHWPTDYSSIFVLVIFDFSSICHLFVNFYIFILLEYCIYNMEIKFD